MTHGAESYGKFNWRKGLPLMSYMRHAQRHLSRAYRMLDGDLLEDVCDKCHGNEIIAEIQHCAANVLMLIETYELMKSGELPYDAENDASIIEHVNK